MIEGGCLCGSIRYRAERIAGPLVHCHCHMCRKAHGSAFCSLAGEETFTCTGAVIHSD